MSTTPVDELFPAGHLRELVVLVDREVRLPPSWETNQPGTMMAVVRDEAELTSSRGVVVIHTAFTIPEGIAHALNFAAEKPRSYEPQFVELGQIVAGWLKAEATVTASKSVTGASVNFTLSRSDEQKFQATRLDISDEELGVAVSRLNAVAKTAGKAWWRFW